MRALERNWYFDFADEAWGRRSSSCPRTRPTPAWCCCNGHEWLELELTHAGVAFTALHSGLRLVEGPAAARRVSAGHVRALLTRMTAAIPYPLMPVDRFGECDLTACAVWQPEVMAGGL